MDRSNLPVAALLMGVLVGGAVVWSLGPRARHQLRLSVEKSTQRLSKELLHALLIALEEAEAYLKGPEWAIRIHSPRM